MTSPLNDEKCAHNIKRGTPRNKMERSRNLFYNQENRACSQNFKMTRKLCYISLNVYRYAKFTLRMFSDNDLCRRPVNDQ